MIFLILTPLLPCTWVTLFWEGGRGGEWGGPKFGGPIATTVSRFGSTTHSTFFFSVDPLTNDGGPGCYFRLSKMPPKWGPTGGHFQAVGLAERLQFLGDLCQTPGTLGPFLSDHLVTMGLCIKSCNPN